MDLIAGGLHDAHTHTHYTHIQTSNTHAHIQHHHTHTNTHSYLQVIEKDGSGKQNTQTSMHGFNFYGANNLS